ncbi:MAG: alanine dehydrogenase [Bacteroidales bacterium]|nr:alanine dehydrogenase [Bacteroidales bacterium]
MEDPLSEITRRSTAERLMPQEEMLEVTRRKSQLVIGVPKEITPEEKRVALVPDGVTLLTQQGNHVLVEAGAGKESHFADHQYSEAGAQIVYSPQEVYKSDMILKVAPLTNGETDFLRPKQTLVSALQMATQKEGYFRSLMTKKITALAYELIRDKTQSFPIVRAMSEIAGCTSIFIAAEYLSSPDLGRGKMFGGFTGISPSEVVIIGAGTVGEFAARSALGLGALVKVFDNSVYRLRRLQNNLGTRIFTSILHPKTLLESMKTADVVIGAVHSPGGKSPCLIIGEMIRHMKEGSIIIDVSIDQGGCFETSRPTTHSNPVFKEHGVTHYCVPNIASRVPHTASQALNNIFVPVILDVCSEGGIEALIKKDYGLRQGVYLFNGTITNLPISKIFKLPFQDIELLMAAFR